MKKTLTTILLFSLILNLTTLVAKPKKHLKKRQLPVVGVLLAGRAVKDIISDFQNAASQLLFQGENRGNALLSSLGNQLSVETQNANIVFKDQQKLLFGNLDKSSQDFFTQLNNVIKTPESSIDRAVSILEVLNLNLIDLTNRLPLTKKTYAYINNVKGITQIHQDGDYQIEADGLGFGQDQENAKYKIEVKVGNYLVPVASISRTPPYKLIANINHQVLEEYFSDGVIKSIPLTIRVQAVITNKCNLFFNCTENVSNTWNMKMVLMPRYPGTVTGVELLTSESLDGITKTKSVDVTTQGCKTDQPCDWQREIPFAANERVIGVRYSCVGQCGWSYKSRPSMPGDQYAPDYDILEGGTKVRVYRHVDGGSSTTVTYYVDYQTLKANAVERKLNSVKVQFGKAITINLSNDNTSCYYRLTGRLVTGQEIYIDNSMTESPNKILTRVGVGKGPLTCSPSFVLNMP